MENETQNTRGVPNGSSRADSIPTSFDVSQPTPQQVSPAPVEGVFTPNLSDSQNQPVAPVAIPTRPPRVANRAWLNKRTLLIAFALAAVVGLGLVAWRFLIPQSQSLNSAGNNHTAENFGTLDIPLSGLSQSGQLSFDSSRSLNINGQLKVNSGFVIAPSDKPVQGVAGQMYYDRGTNELNYYNGSGFVSLTNNPQTVISINGTSGALTLGGGLSLNGSQLSSNGVVSITSASTNLAVANDGNGNITLNSSGVQSTNAAAGSIALFSDSQTITSSILTQSGNKITVDGGLDIAGAASINGGATVAGTLNLLQADTTTINLTSNTNGVTGQIYNDGNLHITGGSNNLWLDAGGTGTIFVNAANTNKVAIGEATIPLYPLEVNGDINITAGHSYRIGGTVICSISGCTGGGGGTNVSSLNGLTGDLTINDAVASGSAITIHDASTSQKGIASFNSTNFTVTSGAVNTVQDIAVSSAPTFGRLTVTSAQASNGMLLVNNTNGSGTGNLIDLQLNGSSKFAVSPAGALTLSSTINGQTISSLANFTGTLTVGGAASLNGGATVTGTLTANTITPTSSLTVGAVTQSFTVQGNASSTLTATNAGNTTTVAFQSPTASVTYRLLTAAAGTYDICTTVGNCAGVGGGVTTPGGTANTIAKFTGSGSIGNSIITDNGTTVAIGGTLSVNTITPAAAMSIGATTQNLTLQGAVTQLTATSGGITNTFTFATPASSNKTITVPNASGTVAVSATGPLSIDANGNISCPSCVTSGGGGGGVSAVDSVDGLTGALTIANSTGTGTTVTINDASTSQKGLAQFNSTNFSATGGVVNTIQNINTAAAPTFGQLTLTSSQGSATMLTVNNTNASATGNLIDLKLNGTSEFAVTSNGNVTLNGTINGQTISSVANFTGTVGVSGNLTTSSTLFANAAGITTDLNVSGTTTTSALSVTNDAGVGGNLNVTGTLTANTIAPTSALTVGATSVALTLQGNASSKITATGGGFTTTVGFTGTAAGAVTYNFDRAASAGTYTICTTAGNCSGVGGGVTTPGGTTNAIPKFTGAQTLGDSNISDNGSTVTIAVGLNVNTITPTSAMTLGATGQNLTLQGATVSLTATSGGITNSLTFATPSGTNKTITLPNASGTVAVSASGALSLDANGNITCPSCVTGSAVSSLNSQTGAVSLANAVGSGGVVTINDASTSQKGIAQFNSTNFSATGGTVNTVQDINTTAAPTFGRLTVTSNQGSANMFVVNNTNISTTGSLLKLQLNGTDKFTVDSAGNVVAAGTITSGNVNGQTISSAANFTGSVAIATTLNVNTITPTGAMTVGATNQDLTLQGATTRLSATATSITNTLTFATPTGTNKTITLPDTSGTVCLDSGNCLGGSGGANASLSNLSSVAINASLLPGSAGSINVGSGTLPWGDIYLSGASSTPGTNNFRLTGTSTSGTRALTLPDASGTICLQGSVSCGFLTTTPTLQQAYNASTDPEFVLDGTRAAITIRDAASPLGTNLFEVQDNAATVDYFAVAATGSVFNRPLTVRALNGDSSTLFNVKNAGDNNLFTVDSNNSRVGINLGGSVLPTLSGGGLEVHGSLRLSGTASDSDLFVTPLSATLSTRINIPLYQQAGYAPVIALGVQSNSPDTARGIVVADARTVTHQPTIGILNPNEQNIFGLSWDGDNSVADLKSSGDAIAIQANGLNIGTFKRYTSSDGRLGIMNGSPSYPLDVTGDINTTTAYRIGGTSVCDTTGTTGCLAKSGSGYYIHNQTSLQGANLNIQASDTTAPTAIFEQGASGTADILDVMKNDGTTKYLSISSAGNLTVANGSTYSLDSSTSGSVLSSGAITVTAGAASTWSTSSGDLTVQSGGTNLNLQAGASGIVNVGANAVSSKTINIGSTGSIANTSTVNIGTTSGNATQSVNVGSTGSANNAVLIQGGTSATAIQLQVGSGGTIGIANNAVAQTVKVGNVTGGTAVTVNSGSGNITLTSTASTIVKQSGTATSTAFQVQNVAGTSTFFDVDAASGRVGINTSSPASMLQANQSNFTPGTVSNSASGTTVTGSSTTFLTSFQPGDTFTITSSSNTCTVKQVLSDTSLVCVSALASSSSGSAYSFTQQTRLSVTDSGNTTVAGTLSVSNPGVSDQYSIRVNSTTGAFNLSANTIGNTSTGIASDVGNNGTMSASQYNSGTGGTINALRVYFPVVQASPNNHVKVAVYTDASGAPGTIVSSATAPSTVVTAATWTTVSLGQTITLTPNTNYWLVFNVDGSSTTYGFSNGSGSTAKYIAMTYGSNFPNSFGTPTASGSAEYTVYGAYATVTDVSAAKSALSIDSNNSITVQPNWDTTAAFQVLRAGGTATLQVDTVNDSVNANHLGLGAVDSTYSLSIQSNSNTAKIYRTTSTTTANLLELYSDVGSTDNLKFKVQANGNIFTDGSTTIGTPADLAENYPVAEPVEPGDVVVFKNGMKLGKTTTAYDHRLAGVVSTDPGVILSGNTDGATMALKGRVPVKVSDENGTIAAGDPLTASATKPGYAMKATSAGMIIGTALEPLNSGTGSIQVFLNVGYNDPSQNMQGTTQFQDVNVQGTLTAANINVTGTATIHNLSVTGSATITNLAVTDLTTAALTINGHIVTGGGKPVVTNMTCSGTDVDVDGTDTTGLITVTTPAGCNNDGDIANIAFAKAFTKVPHITISPANANASSLKTYVDSDAITPTSFTIATPTNIDGSKTYKWYYQVLQ